MTNEEPLHASEVPGSDLKCDEDGFWRGIAEKRMGQGSTNCKIVVDAGPIVHRGECILLHRVMRHCYICLASHSRFVPGICRARGTS